MNRRDFLKGLFASVAAGALVKGGVVQPPQVIDEPKARVFDMAANTWRAREPWWISRELVPAWSATFDPPLEFDGTNHLEIEVSLPMGIWMSAYDGIYVCDDIQCSNPTWRLVKPSIVPRCFGQPPLSDNLGMKLV